MDAGRQLRQPLAGRPAVGPHRHSAAEAQDSVRVASDRLPLGRELARLPRVVGIEQRDPVAILQLGERCLPRLRWARAVLVMDDGVLRPAAAPARAPTASASSRKGAGARTGMITPTAYPQCCG